MIRILSLLISLLLISLPAHAGTRATTKRITINNVAVSDYALGSGETATSDSVMQVGNVGFSSMVMEVNGQVDITYQVSLDRNTWYDPYTTDGNSLTAANALVSNLSADRWIIFTAKLAPYIRFKFTGDSSSTITATYLYQQQD